jgi:hypothetical protein
MGALHCPVRLGVFSSVLLLSLPAFTQQAPNQIANSHHVAFYECQGINGCATWIFLDKKGVATWPSGEKAILEVTSTPGSQTISISRTDVEGATAGLTGTYTGSYEGNELGGTYRATYNGQPLAGHWYFQPIPDNVSVTQPSSGSLPKTLQITECEGPNCAIDSRAVTWAFNGSDGVGAFGTGRQPLHVDSYNGNSIVVRRTDTVGNWLGSAIYTGRISDLKIDGRVRYFERDGQRYRDDVWTGVIGNVILPQPAGVQGPTLQDIYSGIDHLKTAIDIFNYLAGSSSK